jgi:uncharacterized BrkB/YihY/UPF0761 family membrane protein
MRKPLPTGGRFSPWAERARALGPRLERARASHSAVDLGLAVVERDSAIGGGLLAGALAYRMFVVLLPTALLLVSGLGLYADAADKSASAAVKDAGLHGLIASEVASTASSRAAWIVFLLMLPAVLYSIAKLYRAVAIAHAIAWSGSGRGARTTPGGVALLGLTLAASVVGAEVTGWARRTDNVGAIVALAAYLAVVGGAWLLVCRQLPHREAGWTALLPGACLVGLGLLVVNVFNVYITTRIVENRANTYGALGIAAALLFSLVLVGRVIVVSAELNASLADRRAPNA